MYKKAKNITTIDDQPYADEHVSEDMLHNIIEKIRSEYAFSTPQTIPTKIQTLIAQLKLCSFKEEQ